MSAPTNPFQKATKQQIKARIGLAGPTGSGKTWTALEMATVLAEASDGRIAVVDTERRSASLYADRFDFDAMAMDPPYEPQRCADALRAAEANGYTVAVIDSLTHFWQGEGGTLDIVDAVAQKSYGGNKYAGWAVGTPALRYLVDTILGVDLHVIVTMRSKMDYVEEVVNGRKTYVRVGMAPIMRDGIEYEFTVLGDVDLEHRIVINKTRCAELDGKVIQPGRARDAAVTFLDWLENGEPDPAIEARERLTADLKALPEGQRTAMAKWIKDRYLPAVSRMTLENIVTVRDELARLASQPPASDDEASAPDGPGVADTEPDAGDVDAFPPTDGPEGPEPPSGPDVEDLEGDDAHQDPPPGDAEPSTSDGETAPPPAVSPSQPTPNRNTGGKMSATQRSKLFAELGDTFPPPPQCRTSSDREQYLREILLNQLCPALGVDGLTSRGDIQKDLGGRAIDSLGRIRAGEWDLVADADGSPVLVVVETGEVAA